MVWDEQDEKCLFEKHGFADDRRKKSLSLDVKTNTSCPWVVDWNKFSK